MYPKFEGAAVWFYKKLGVAWCLLRLYETFGIAGLLAVLMRPCARGKSDKEKNVPLRRSSKSPMMDVIVEDGDSMVKPNEAPLGSSEEPRSKESRPFTVHKSTKPATKPKPFNLSSGSTAKNKHWNEIKNNIQATHSFLHLFVQARKKTSEWLQV